MRRRFWFAVLVVGGIARAVVKLASLATNTAYVEFSWSDRTRYGIEPTREDRHDGREWIEERD